MGNIRNRMKIRMKIKNSHSAKKKFLFSCPPKQKEQNLKVDLLKLMGQVAWAILRVIKMVSFMISNGVKNH